MIFVHELHEVVGAREEAFEAAFRDRLVPALADDDDARLLYFLHHAHGSGASYRVVTITALRDAAAFWRLQERFDTVGRQCDRKRKVRMCPGHQKNSDHAATF